MTTTLLIIDDERTIRLSLKHHFQKKGFRVVEAGTSAQGLAAAAEHGPDVVLLDLKLPDLDGLGTLEKLRGTHPDAAVIMLTGHGKIKDAVAAMKMGAAHFLTKGADLEEVDVQVEKALERLRVEREVAYYRQRLGGEGALHGEAPSIGELNRLIDLLAESANTTVLISGESGTGKELVARAIHAKSARRDKPFMEINCAGLSENLLDSELFGHERGAFTDAKTMKRGLLEVADGGTVFLDEIGDMPGTVQPKLLKVLETKTFRRVGGTRDISVDVRIITATNRDLAKLVGEGRFREDLYYRLRVMPLTTPPLRERGTDILILANLFVQEFNALLKKQIKGFSKEALAILMAYPWPGNVRELKNLTERAMILCSADLLLPTHLPAELQALAGSAPPLPPPPAGQAATPLPAGPGQKKGDFSRLDQMEKEYIKQVLAATDGNRSQTARILGISRSTLQDKIKRYRI
ncbi:MAG: sigma-54-dependent Fis family transcriptional regulator [candidate division NC10 bacterium]|nr:sigma-54-dependent Fis family transcriptional regulator [candidate division NC10 bacterium]